MYELRYYRSKSAKLNSMNYEVVSSFHTIILARWKKNQLKFENNYKIGKLMIKKVN